MPNATPNYLVAIDLSDESEEVLTAACQLAQGMSATLTVITVIQPLTGLLGSYDFVPVDEGVLAFEEDASRITQAKLQELAAQFGIPAEQTHVKAGKPATEIRKQAEAMGADLVIIGNHQRHGMDRLLGSTAHAVLNDATFDAMVVNIHPFE